MRVPALFVLLTCAASPAIAASDAPTDAERVQRGRYLAAIGGCHDCHTPGYAMNAGKVPESQWLIGDQLGYNGLWGTTYPGNLRQRIGGMDQATWIGFARRLVTRPPMPYWSLNAMSDDDLAALWAFTTDLGASANTVPAALAAGVEPKGPVVRFPQPPR